MKLTSLAHAAETAIYLACDVSVAASQSLADSVARVAAAVIQNVAVPCDNTPEPPPTQVPDLPEGIDALPFPPALAHALGLTSRWPAAPPPLPEATHLGPVPIREWVPLLAAELTGNYLAQINDRIYEIKHVLHAAEDGFYGDPQTKVHLHVRDVITGDEGILSTGPRTPILAEPHAPDDLAGLDGTGGTTGVSP